MIKQKKGQSFDIKNIKNQKMQNLNGNKIIVNYLKNIQSHGKADFYARLSAHQLETILTSCFYDYKLSQCEVYNMSCILKQNTLILGLALSNQKFNLMSLFNFFNEDNASLQKLGILEDMLIPFAKKTPQKFIFALKNQKEPKQFLKKYSFHRSIYKILYTFVFCMQRTFIIELNDIIKQLINHLIQSTFVLTKTESQIHSKGNDLEKRTNNLNQFLADLTTNLVSVDILLVQYFLQSFDQSKIQKLFTQLLKYKNDETKEDYCQNILLIFFHLLKILEIFKITNHSQHISADDEIIKYKVGEQLLRKGKLLSSKMNIFATCLIEGSKNTLNFSSGQKIFKVGMIRYRILLLLQKILSINQIQNIGIDLNSTNLFEIIQIFVQKYKWNNIVHIVLIQIIELLMSQFYKTFDQLYIREDNHNFFGSLIKCFRNRRYIFLHSMRMTNNGNRHALFQISKILINQMQQKKGLQRLIDKSKHWRQFMETDMKQYEQISFQQSSYFNNHMIESREKRSKNSIDQGSQGHHHKPLQTIQEILNHLKQENSWSPKTKRLKNKQLIIDRSVIRKMDSLAQFFDISKQ